MPFQQLVGVFLLARELSTYFLKDILGEIGDYREQIKVRFVLKLCLLYLLFIGSMLFHVINLSSYVFVAVCLFLTLNILTPFIIKFTGSVYLPTKILLLGAFVCIAHVHVVIGNAEGLGIVLWYLIIILSATFVLGLDWGIFYTIFSLGLIAFFNTTVYLELELMGNSELSGLKRLVMFPFRVGLPVAFLVVIAKEFLKSREAAENMTMKLLEEQISLINQLTESEQEYRELIEEAADMIFKIDKKGRFFYVNPVFLEATGYTREEVIGKSASLLLLEKDKPIIRTFFLQQIAKQQQHSYKQFQIITKSGKKIWIGQKTKMIFDDTGKRVQSFCVARNITEQHQLNLLLEKAKSEAERQNELKNNFMSAVSHELRTPLNAVIALGHDLSEKETCPARKEDLETLLYSSENLLGIIKDVTNVSLIEAGQLKLNSQPFDLEKIQKTLLKTTQRLTKNKNLQVEVYRDPKVPTLLIGDEVRLLQILNNLVQNAVKFTKEGFIKVSILLKKESNKEACIHFEVADSGIGIEQALLDRIFDRFTQAETNLSRSYGGIGVGLTIVKEMVTLFGSQIHVESEVGTGSTFSFSISFKKQRPKPVLPTTPTKQQSKDQLRGVSVLLVEDNKVNQLVAMKFLKKWQTKITLAENGQIAVDKAKQQDFDIILMDLEMPVMNGIEATKHIRNLPNGKDFPIVAVTASVANSIVDSLQSGEFTDIVTKPYTPDVLYQKMVLHLKKELSSI